MRKSRFPPESCISHDPGKRNLHLPQALDHLPGQLTLGLKACFFWNTSFSAPFRIVSPFFGEVEFPVDERVSFVAHVAEKDADLTILNPSSGPTILLFDAC